MMIKYLKHIKNLETFYLDKGLSATDSIHFAKEKIKKVEISENVFSYNIWLEKLIPYLRSEINLTSEKTIIVDFGCGSGELVILMRSMGIEAYGYDVYEKEIKIAHEFALENGYEETIFFSNKLDLFNHLGNNKIDILTSFSVLEHLSDKFFLEKLDDFKDHISGCVFALVPSKYKITDDHTGLKFLGLFPRSIAQIIVSLAQSNYKLSEGGDWDVWYRSIKQFKELISSRDMELNLIDEAFIYPSLLEVHKIGDFKYTSFKSLIEKIYSLLILIITRNNDNLYPYLNFVIKKR